MTTVLLAEDDPDLRELASIMLGLEGFEVVRAEDGQKAMEMLERHADYRALVLDMSMPGHTGLEVARAARSRGYVGPVILWTGWDMVLESDALHSLDVDLVAKHDVMRLREEVGRRIRAFRQAGVVGVDEVEAAG